MNHIGRRRFLSLSAVTGAVAIAGCSGESSSSQNADSAATNSGGGGSGTDSGGSSGSGGGSTATSGPQIVESTNNFGVLNDYGWVSEGSDYEAPSLGGTAVNTGDSTLDYASVEVAFYSADNTQIGTGLDNTNNLAGGSRWEYETLSTDDFTTADVDSLSFSLTAY